MAGRRSKRMFTLQHPLVIADVTTIRNTKTGNAVFRDALERVSIHLAAAALSQLRVKRTRVRTPIAFASGGEIHTPVVLIPVLRAGLGLLSGFLKVHPKSSVGHVGVYRDERTLEPVHYYVRLPRDLRRSLSIILDPMLATGGSACAAVELVKKRSGRNIVLATLIAAPEGIRRVRTRFPDVTILTCAVDSKLNARGFIVPGLGDAGDRLFGTEEW